MTDLPEPEPVFDVSDLTRIAALPDVADPTPAAESDDWKANAPARRVRAYQRWLTAARRLAAAGVEIAPSHYEHDGRNFASVWGAFRDTDDVTAAFDQEPGSRWRRSEPLVMFATIVSPDASDLPYLPGGYRYIAVGHQSAGMACHHRHLVGVVLPLTDAGFRKASAVTSFCDRNGHDCVGIGGLRLAELADYRDLLATLDLTAERQYQHLEEGFYPLDRQCAAAFTDDRIPSDDELDEPVEPELNERQAALARLWRFGKYDRWGVFVLGPNCD